MGFNMDILRQTVCRVVNSVMVDNFAFLFRIKSMGLFSD